MNARVTITPEGNIAIPNDERKAFDGAVQKLRAIAHWPGPRYDDAHWKAAIDAQFRNAA